MKKRIIITEGQYRKLLKEDELMKISHLQDMLQSKSGKNIELAFTLRANLNIPFSVLLEPFRDLFEFLKRFGKIETETLNKDAFYEIRQLKVLNLSSEDVLELPALIGNLTSLRYLNLNHTHIMKLPDSIGDLANLYEIRVVNVPIQTLPESFGNLTNLSILKISESDLRILPESFGNLQNLDSLYLFGNRLEELPKSFYRLSNLKVLNLRDNQFVEPELQKIKRNYPFALV